MKLRSVSIFTLLLCLALMSVLALALVASAQDSEPAFGPGSLDTPPGRISDPAQSGALPFYAPETTRQAASASEVALGEPGLSFRYAETFGVTEEPYFSDPTYINRPWGLFMDPSDNLYVVDVQGSRLLRYDSEGVNTLDMGMAGVCYTGDAVFCQPKDVTLDGSGNIWLADGNRVVQYDVAGEFLQQQPATDPWASGNDNERFDWVNGIAFDSSEHMYVADTNNHRVQVYSLSGGTPVYSTTIGVTDTPGDDNLHFDFPYRVEVDSSDRLYVLDRGNQRVQRCEFAVGWSCSPFDTGYVDPEGLTLDSSDNVYIADNDPGRLRKCTSGGVCTDLVVGGYWLRDLAVDSAGRIYGSAAYENYIQRIDSDGTWLDVFVGVPFVPYLTDGYHYNHPRVAIDDDDNILILEEEGHRLVKLDANGVFQWSVGEPGVHGSDEAHFSWPHGVAADADGYVYVADGNNRVQIFEPDGAYHATLGTGWGTGEFEFKWVVGVAVGGNGHIYVSDAGNHRVQIYDSNRQYLDSIGVTGECGSDSSHLCSPIGVEVDASGNVYVADAANCRVQKFDSSWAYQMTFGTTGSCGSTFSEVSAEDVAVDDRGRVYVSGWDDRVQVFDSAGNYLTTIGGAWGTNSSQFRGASGVDLDSNGNVYVADLQNARIQKYALGVPGWRQVNINGFGDILNGGVTSLAPFGSALYAGTYNRAGAGAQLWRSSPSADWSPVMTGGFGNAENEAIDHLIEFDGWLYAGTWSNETNGGEVWRSEDGVDWEQVVSQGFGNPANSEVFRFGVFDNWLYASTWSRPSGGEVWRSSTGDSGTWDQVASGGFGDANNTSVLSFEPFNTHLYAGTYNGTTGTEVWRSPSGDSGTWTQVNADGFGDPGNYGASGLAVFEGYLYAISSHLSGVGAEVWRCQTCDGTDWEQVLDDGFSNAPPYHRVALETLGDRLYAVVGNSTTGLEVWRTGDGLEWEQVGFAGFGDSNNVRPYWGNSVLAFNGGLYIGTLNYANGGELWLFLSHKIYLPLVVRNH